MVAEPMQRNGEQPVDLSVTTKTSEKDLVAIHPIRLGMALNIPVTAHRQIPIDRTVQKTIETPQLHCIDSVVDGPVVLVEHVPQAHVAEKTVETPQLDVVEKTAETPETQTIHGTQTSENLSTAPVRQVAQSEVVEAIEIGVKTIDLEWSRCIPQAG